MSGPKSKRETYRLAIEKVMNGPLGDDWASSDQIAHEANKHISNYWKQLNGYSVGAIMRKYIASGHVEGIRPKGATQPKTYRRLLKFEGDADEYEFKGGNWKGYPRVWFTDEDGKKRGVSVKVIARYLRELIEREDKT